MQAPAGAAPGGLRPSPPPHPSLIVQALLLAIGLDHPQLFRPVLHSAVDNTGRGAGPALGGVHRHMGGRASAHGKGQALEQARQIAVTEGAQEVRLDPPAGEELPVDRLY